MSKPLSKSRPTAYLSAGLLLLPIAAQAASPSEQWACQVAPNGGWACQSKPVAPGTPPRPERPSQPETARKPLATAVAAPTAEPTAAPVTAPEQPVPIAAPAQPTTASAPVSPSAKPVATSPAPAATTQSTPEAPTPQTPQQVASDWDWVANTKPGVCCKPNTTCQGSYIEPVQNWPDSDKKPKDVPVRASAPQSQWEGNVVKLDGGVTVTQGNVKLTADRAEYDQSTNQARLYGNVVVRQPGTKITGSNADLTTDNSFGDVVDARMLDYASGARVTANKLTRRKEDVVELDEATYTRCPPDREDWQLDSKHIRLNRKTGRGEAGDTVLRLGDMPVFYTPYMNFPIDDRRQSGFLWPSIASGSVSGLDITVPYYFNLAPNYDATLTPRFISDRGTMIEAETRYLNRFSSWQINGTHLSDDKRTGTERWFLGIQEQGQITSRFGTAIDYSKVSDDDYFRDFSVASLNIKRQTYLNQEVDLRYGYNSWYAQLTAQQYQNLDDALQEPYRKLPQLTIGRTASGANFQLDYSMLLEGTDFDLADRNTQNDARPTGDRIYAQPGISFPMRWAPGYIKPQFLLRHVSYRVDWPEIAGPQKKAPSVTVPQTILDAGLYFDRDFAFRDKHFLQTLEPRLYYLYSPYKNQTDQPNFDTSPLTFDYHQLFQPRRFTGHDRLEDFNQMSVGMTTRFIENETGRELANASLGQIFYFADRKVNTLTNLAPPDQQQPDSQTNSSIAGQLAIQPNDPLWASVNLLWSPDQNQVEQANTYIHYQPNDRAIYNLGYRYNRANPEVTTLFNGIRQVDASAALPLSLRWRAFLRLNYDLDMKSSLEDLVGVEYEDCCWRVRVMYQRAIFGEGVNTIGPVGSINRTETERDQAIMVEFQLKGLGGLGRRVSTLLEESIWGYKERE